MIRGTPVYFTEESVMGDFIILPKVVEFFTVAYNISPVLWHHNT